MFITRVEASGFAGLGRLDLSFDRLVLHEAPPRALTALADALLLPFAACDAEACRALLRRWGCEGVTVEGAPLPEAASWERAPGLAAVLEPGGDGLCAVALTIQLDPPQFGRLRRESARDTRLVDALANGAVLHLRVGARFATGLDAVALDLLTCTIGGEPFAVAGSDRPPWLQPLLRGLAGRVQRGGVPASRWVERAGSYHHADQRSLRAAAAALRGAPLELGEVVVMPDGPAVYTEDAVVPVRHYGDRMAQLVGLVGAVHLSGADVLVVEHPPPELEAWLGRQVEGDPSPLEQVILLGGGGGAPYADEQAVGS